MKNIFFFLALTLSMMFFSCAEENIYKSDYNSDLTLLANPTTEYMLATPITLILNIERYMVSDNGYNIIVNIPEKDYIIYEGVKYIKGTKIDLTEKLEEEQKQVLNISYYSKKVGNNDVKFIFQNEYYSKKEESLIIKVNEENFGINIKPQSNKVNRNEDMPLNILVTKTETKKDENKSVLSKNASSIDEGLEYTLIPQLKENQGYIKKRGQNLDKSLVKESLKEVKIKNSSSDLVWVTDNSVAKGKHTLSFIARSESGSERLTTMEVEVVLPEYYPSFSADLSNVKYLDTMLFTINPKGLENIEYSTTFNSNLVAEFYTLDNQKINSSVNIKHDKDTTFKVVFKEVGEFELKLEFKDSNNNIKEVIKTFEVKHVGININATYNANVKGSTNNKVSFYITNEEEKYYSYVFEIKQGIENQNFAVSLDGKTLPFGKKVSLSLNEKQQLNFLYNEIGTYKPIIKITGENGEVQTYTMVVQSEHLAYNVEYNMPSTINVGSLTPIDFKILPLGGAKFEIDYKIRYGFEKGKEIQSESFGDFYISYTDQTNNTVWDKVDNHTFINILPEKNVRYFYKAKKSTFIENEEKKFKVFFYIEDKNGNKVVKENQIKIEKFDVELRPYENRILNTENSSVWHTIPDSVQFVFKGTDYTDFEFKWVYNAVSDRNKAFWFFRTYENARVEKKDQNTMDYYDWYDIKNMDKLFFRSGKFGGYTLDITVRSKANHSVQTTVPLDLYTRELNYNDPMTQSHIKSNNTCQGDKVGKPYNIVVPAKMFKGSVKPPYKGNTKQEDNSHADYTSHHNPNHKARLFIGSVINAIEWGYSIDGFVYKEDNHCE